MLDVREEHERTDSRDPGAIRHAASSTRRHSTRSSRPRQPRVHDARAARARRLAASLLVRRGFDARPVVGGGVRTIAKLNALLVS